MFSPFVPFRFGNCAECTRSNGKEATDHDTRQPQQALWREPCRQLSTPCTRPALPGGGVGSARQRRKSDGHRRSAIGCADGLPVLEEDPGIMSPKAWMAARSSACCTWVGSRLSSIAVIFLRFLLMATCHDRGRHKLARDKGGSERLAPWPLPHPWPETWPGSPRCAA